MAFREVPVFEVREMLRLWLLGYAIRAIARMVQGDRKTVTRVVRIAEGLGLSAGDDVARQGIVVPQRTLNRFIAAEFGAAVSSTVLLAEGEPGVELQVDFGELGRMVDEETAKRRKVWALVFTPVFSRYSFVWLSFSQNMTTVIDGFEAAWEFFGGVFKVVIPDNMATVVTKADALDPVLNQGFIEYAQARGFVVDPARVRSPKDKARVERAVHSGASGISCAREFPTSHTERS